MFSQEYLAALALVIVSIAAIFGLRIDSDFVNALITVVIGGFIMYRRYKKGDIMATGIKKI